MISILRRGTTARAQNRALVKAKLSAESSIVCMIPLLARTQGQARATIGYTKSSKL